MPFLDDWRHWQERAREALAIADDMRDAVARGMMLEIATTYEQMATDARLMNLVVETAKPSQISSLPN